jgi:hypothetical protein
MSSNRTELCLPDWDSPPSFHFIWKFDFFERTFNVCLWNRFVINVENNSGKRVCIEEDFLQIDLLLTSIHLVNSSSNMQTKSMRNMKCGKEISSKTSILSNFWICEKRIRVDKSVQLDFYRLIAVEKILPFIFEEILSILNNQKNRCRCQKITVDHFRGVQKKPRWFSRCLKCSDFSRNESFL